MVGLARMQIGFSFLFGGIQTHLPRDLPHSEVTILTTGLLQKRNSSQIPLALERIAWVLLYYKRKKGGLENLSLKVFQAANPTWKEMRASSMDQRAWVRAECTPSP